MSSERQRGESCGSQSGGKLFQMTGPVTVKLLIPSVVLVLGTDSNLGASGPKVSLYLCPTPTYRTHSRLDKLVMHMLCATAAVFSSLHHHRPQGQ